MTRARRRLLLVLGCLLALAAAAALLLPALVDVDRYRPVIVSRAEAALGRPVRLGEMRLTLLPRLGLQARDVALGATPAEGGGDLLTARSLQVGARLLPLLRKRLEITSVVLDQPRLVLARDAQGTWNVQRIVAGGAGEAAPAGQAGGGFRLDRLRVRGGQVEVRDAGLRPGRELTASLSGLSLDLADLAPGQDLDVSLSATLEGARPARLVLRGQAGPLADPAGGPLRIRGEVELSNLDPTAHAPWLEAAAGPGWVGPDGLLGSRPVSLRLSGGATLVTGQDGALALQAAEVAGAELAGGDLRLRRGPRGWELPPAPAGAAPAPGDGPQLTLRDLRLSDLQVRLVDATAAAPRETVLEQVGLVLDRLPEREVARLEASARVGGGRKAGRLAVAGTVGPLAAPAGRAGEAPLPVDLKLDLQEIPLAVVGPLLEPAVALAPSEGTLGLGGTVKGDLRGRFQAAGSLALAGARVALPAAGGAPRPPVLLDLDSRFDVAAAGAILEFRALELRTGPDTLKLEGKVDGSGRLVQVDMRLHPARVAAERLAALLTLAGVELPVAFSSGQPVELEARVRGAVGGEAYPALDARLKLADFTFRHPAMSRPMEQVRGSIRLQGETVEIREFAGRLGGSDVGGELTLTGFQRPRIRFALQSQRADFWELMSFVAAEESAGGGASTATSGQAGLLDGVEASGTLRIAQGSFQSLAFQELSTTLGLSGQTITLRPFRMRLYQGSFDGGLTLDLGTDPVAFVLETEVQDVDSSPLLADTLQAGQLLSGRFSGSLKARGTGSDYDRIVRNLSGGGSARVVDGRVGGLDVLKSLSKASGVFGEQTLKNLSRKLQKEGTDFSRLEARLALDGPLLRAEELVLESPDLYLKGGAAANLLTASMQAVLQVIFSRELSQSMRAEGSRAASVFWDGKRDQVNLPLTLSGPFTAPAPGIDWSAAAGQLVERKVQEKLKAELGGRLGGLLGGSKEASASGGAPGGREDQGTAAGTPPMPASTPGAGAAPPSPPAAAPASEGASPSASGPAPAAAPETDSPPGGPTAEITKVSWGGPLLARDLRVEGVVRGAGVAAAAATVADAGGRTLHEGPLPEVAAHLAGGADPAAEAAIRWSLEVDGKKLLVARFPLTLTVTVTATDGTTSRATREIRK